MEETVAIIMYILLVLFPINGIIWLGMRAEVIKKRKILRMMWKLGNRR